MERFADAVLTYESRRRQAQEEFHLGYQCWKEKRSHPLTLRRLLAGGDPPEEPNIERDISKLMALCLHFVSGTTLAFAVLLRQFRITLSRGQQELKSHTKAVLEDTYEHRWCHGWMQHWYFREHMDSDLLSRLWSDIEEENSGDIHVGLWSPNIKWKEIKDLDAVLDDHDLLKRLDQKVDLAFKKHRSKQRLTPNPEQLVIIKAINDGQEGPTFCTWLDSEKVGPRPSWKDKARSLFVWPGTYKEAYASKNLEAREFWRKRIYDYRDKAKRKYPHLIHPKNSPTRQSE